MPRRTSPTAVVAALLMAVTAVVAVDLAGAMALRPVVGEVVAVDTTTTPAGMLESSTVAVGHALGAQRGAPTGILVPTGTQMVGLTWEGDGALQVRAREGERWSEWLDLPLDEPDRPEMSESSSGAAPRHAAGPVWLGEDGTSALELRTVTGAVSGVRVEAMTFTASRSPRALVVDHPRTAAGGPPIYTRASWAPGGWASSNPGCSPHPVGSSALRFGVVHHTVSSNSYSAAAVPGILAGIYRFHVTTNGWCDTGYSFFVDRFGRTWEGRSGGVHVPIIGGHAKGFNTDSVGVALIGDHSGGGAPSSAAWTGVRDVLAWKLGSHGVDPRISIPIVSRGSTRYPAGQRVILPTIQGHRDSGLTACPGNHVANRLGWLREQVAARIASTASPGTWAPSRTGAAFFGRIESDALGRITPNGTAGRFTSVVARTTWPRDDLATSLVLSPATDRRIGTVERLYRAAFARDAETAGLRYWVGRRDAGWATISLARQFAASSEFEGRYAHLGDAAFVDAMYRNILGRPGDPSGTEFWVTSLERGMPRYRLLASFAESPENRRLAADDTTITTVGFVLLDRALSRSERAAWRDAFDDGVSPAGMVGLIVGSPEYAAGA